MTKSPSDINHLSQSSISTYMKCPRQWAAQYLDELPRRKGVALIKGSAVDRVATHNWSQKREYGADIATEDAQEMAEQFFRDEIDQAGGRDEIDWGRETMPAALDSSVKMTARHMRDHAPLFTPKGVQVRLSKKLKDGRDFIGFVDAVVDEETLVDVKTGSRRMAAGDAGTDLQATAYAWLTGNPIDFHYLRVIDTGRSPVSSEVVSTSRGIAALTWFDELANNISRLIDDGCYPTVPGWHCSYCPLQNTCVAALTAK